MNITRKDLVLLKKSVGQHIRVDYIKDRENFSTVRKLLLVDFSGIVIDYPVRPLVVLKQNIQCIEIKNLFFMSPYKVFYNTKKNKDKISVYMDTITTKVIEHMKNLDHYELVTRSASFVKNGSFTKIKHPKTIFEKEVFDWMKKSEHALTIIPLALLNKDFLLAIYMERFVLINKDRSLLFPNTQHIINDIINDVFSHNNEIVYCRSQSLKHLAQDLL